MATPRLSGFSMLPEWAPHERTWMEFPSENFTFTVDDGWLDHCRGVWASVANTIARSSFKANGEGAISEAGEKLIAQVGVSFE